MWDALTPVLWVLWWVNARVRRVCEEEEVGAGDHVDINVTTTVRSPDNDTLEASSFIVAEVRDSQSGVTDRRRDKKKTLQFVHTSI